MAKNKKVNSKTEQLLKELNLSNLSEIDELFRDMKKSINQESFRC